MHFLRLREREWISPVVRSAAGKLHNVMNLNGPNGHAVREQTTGLKEVCDAAGIKTGKMAHLRRRAR